MLIVRLSSSGQQQDPTDLYNYMQDLQAAGNELIAELRRRKKSTILNGVKQSTMFDAVQLSLLDLVISAYSDYHDNHPSVQIPIHPERFLHLAKAYEVIATARFDLGTSRLKQLTYAGLAQALEGCGATLAQDLQKIDCGLEVFRAEHRDFPYPFLRDDAAPSPHVRSLTDTIAQIKHDLAELSYALRILFYMAPKNKVSNIAESLSRLNELFYAMSIIINAVKLHPVDEVTALSEGIISYRDYRQLPQGILDKIAKRLRRLLDFIKVKQPEGLFLTDGQMFSLMGCVMELESLLKDNVNFGEAYGRGERWLI